MLHTIYNRKFNLTHNQNIEDEHSAVLVKEWGF